MPRSVTSCKSQRNCTFGATKSEEMFNKWKESLGIELKSSSRICEVHFKHGDVEKTWESGQGDNKHTVSIYLLLTICYCLKPPVNVLQ